ncbi:hypothetical protein AAH979_37745 [Plantactinospora sp. ZYX-F-223]|uniref:hypothetical protein n=1 Tax=Plantactinospora sp. ZYX-F-223 TaxID=3144103 RepID=UPI0031FDB68B
MIKGWDAIDWADYEGAYGPATETPDILRAIASTDPQTAADGRFEFYSSLHHQGTVYPATVLAVPFLVELAGRPGVHGRAELLSTIGQLCDPDQTNGEAQPSVHAAVAALSDTLLPGLDDPDPQVREATAYALARSGPHHAAALRTRWAVEPTPTVRASLLLGMVLHETAPSADLLRAALAEPFPVPQAAAFAFARAGLPMGADDVKAVAAACDHGEFWRGPWQEEVAGQPPRDLARLLDADSVAALTDALLARSAPSARHGAAVGLEHRFRVSRSASTALMDQLARLLADPDNKVRAAAVDAADAAGFSAAAVADRLATIAGDAATAATADERGRWAAETALTVLVRLGDPRWKEPAMAVWSTGRDPYAVDLFEDHPPAFDQDVLAMVRRRLTVHCTTPRNERHSLLTAATADGPPNAPIDLVQLLHTWGPAASDAVPEILAAYEHASGVAAGALAAIGPAALPAVPALRDRAVDGDIRAGHAVWRLTGDAAPLVGAVVTHLTRYRHGLAWDLRLAADAGTDLAPLVPHLRAWLADTTRTDPHERIALAEMLWRATGDPAQALPTVAAVLDSDRGSDAAARLAAALAPAGANLAPGLWHLLTSGNWWSKPDAARALWRLGTPPGELVEALLAAIAKSDGRPDAVTLLVDMRAVTAVPGLVELAERDERVVRHGNADYVWRDDTLRRHLRTAVTVLTT